MPGQPGQPGRPAPTRNWAAAFGFAILWAFLGAAAGLVLGNIAAAIDIAFGFLVGLASTLIGAFIGTVLGATRPVASAGPPSPPSGPVVSAGPPSPPRGPVVSASPVPPGGAMQPSQPASGPMDHRGPEYRPVDRGGPGYRPVDRGPEYVAPSLFPRPNLPETPRWVLPAVAAVGLLAAIALPFASAGLGLVLVAVAMGVVALPVVWRRITRWSATLGLIGYALAAVPLFLDADWLVGPLLLAGFGIAALALSGIGRTWLGVIKGGASVPLAAFLVPWFLGKPLRALVRKPRRLGHLAIGTGLTLLLLLIFGALFASADPVFSTFLSNVLTAPEWVDTLPGRIVVFVVFAVLVAAIVIVALRPGAEPVTPPIGIRVGRAAWLLPLVALNLLFAAFVAVQITVFFGGNERVVSTAGLTYAEYARQGFFQLVIVSVFVLAIVALAAGVVAVAGRERWVLAVLLGLLCALTMVVLVSALQRITLYTDVYGLSRLRAVVTATILWLGAVFALVVTAGAVRLVRGAGGWLPRALVTVTGVTMIAFAVWNPDLRVAETQLSVRGVDRLDADYLGDLGAEAVPALDRLPEPMRSCVLADVIVANRLDRADSWSGWNLARQRARELLAERPVLKGQDCTAFNVGYGRTE